MSFLRENISDWSLLNIPERVDAFNFEKAKEELQQVSSSSKNVCLNLKEARFISLPTIKFIHSVALETVAKKGCFALIAPTEKIKRQFDIFASLDPVTIYPEYQDWASKYGFASQSKKKRVRIEDSQASNPL